VASAAIEAKDFGTARHVLKPLLKDRLTQRVCTLMARIEGEEYGNRGAVREWLARAVNAPRDPSWTADGVVSEQWAPVSPVTGALDAFQWRVPVKSVDQGSDPFLASKLEELVALGAPGDFATAAPDQARNGSDTKAEALTDRVRPDPANVDVVDLDPETREPARKQSHGKMQPGDEDVTRARPTRAKQQDRSQETQRQEKDPVTGGVVALDVVGDDILVSTEPDVDIKDASAGAHDSTASTTVKTSRKNSGRSDKVPEHELDLEDVSDTTEITAKPVSGSKSELKSGAVPSSRRPSRKERSSTSSKASQIRQEQKTEAVSSDAVALSGKDTSGAGKHSQRPKSRIQKASKVEPAKPEIFVSRRPPDDPGPDASVELDERRPLVNPYSRKASI